uniref:Potassium channel domain-containing protein n=1 Tax=Plectus sambesii TaxID=2011161 RepID=A0A914XAV2_9BILA
MGLLHFMFCFGKCIPEDIKVLTRPVKTNVLLLFCVVVYAVGGGFVFLNLEHSAAKQAKLDVRTTISECIDRIISDSSLEIVKEHTSVMIVRECFPDDSDIRTQWSWTVATLYGFGILTTLGYGRIEPVTTKGRLFCVVFGIIGIPVMMLTLANLGKYISESGPKLRKKLKQLKAYMAARTSSLSQLNQSYDGQDADDDDDSGVEINPTVILVLLLGYVIVGATFLPLLNGRFDFANGIYYTFLCLSAIEFGVLVPENIDYLPITLLYICAGLALTSITIEFGADYVKKFHYIGRKISKCRAVRVWFGGKTLQVNDLLHAVGKNWGVDEDAMNDINLEEVVDVAVKVKEGKLPPGTYVRRAVHGIWPPELVPILLKDGGVPVFADDPESIARHNSMFACAPPLFATEESLKNIRRAPIKSPFFIPPIISTKMQENHANITFIDR